MRYLAPVLLLLAPWSEPMLSESRASEIDEKAIEATARDYIEGWYEGNAERMKRALHPELAKRIIRKDPETGEWRLQHQGAQALVDGTRAGLGRRIPESRRQKDVVILDVFQNAASVKITASDWIDYLHMVQVEGEWLIVNVLWELKPEADY
jgi:hypothetical protein